jgi:ATP-dependent DNA helicase DinG
MSDNCLGQHCPQYAECHVVKARRRAQDADLVVVNHHLLLADLAMKESGFVEFLPDAEAVILDEAHQVPDLAVQFFGVAVGSRELQRIVDEARVATLPYGQAELQRRIDRLDTAVKALRMAAPRQEGRHQLDELMPEMREAFDGLSAALGEAAQGLGSLSDGSADIAKLYEQLLGIGERLALLASEDSWDGLRWLEVNPRSIRVNLTPLDVSSTLSGLIGNDRQAWVFTSATLAIGDDFSHFTSRMGLGAVTGLTFPSPYALAENGLVYLPPGLPQPSDPGHTDAVMEAVTPMLELTCGGVRKEVVPLAQAPAWRTQAARAGHGAARRPAAAIPRCGQRRFARHRQFLGGCRRARHRPDRGCDRQAAVRVAGGPADDGATGIHSS